MKTKQYTVTGMTCASCSAHVEKSVGKLDGVLSVQVQLLENRMKVTYDESQVTDAVIEQAVGKAGYGASAVDENGNVAPRQTDYATKEQAELKRRFWISLGFLLPLLIVAMGPMAGIRLPAFFSGYSGALAYAFTQFLLVLPVVYINQTYFRNGFRSLSQGSPTMDSLIAIGASAAVVYGIFSIYRIGYAYGQEDNQAVFHHVHHLYFESASTILTLITLGKYLEARSKGKTSEAITRLLDLTPKTATVIRAGLETAVPVEEVVTGDEVVLKPGQSAPVDGVVLTGGSSVDESALTGESLPLWKGTGETILSASVNQSGYLTYRATRVGKDTTLAQMIRLVEEAAASKAPVSRLADRISRIFVPVVIGLAFLATIVWLFLGYPFEFALSIGISVLVISCPCALGLATPVAIMVGTGKGAEHGILFKSGEALETARNMQVIVLDKTGTITEGKPVVNEIVAGTQISETNLLQLAASLEKQSEHPLATALLNEADKRGVPLLAVTTFESTPGLGVKGQINGETYLIGNQRFMASEAISYTGSPFEGPVNTFSASGKTLLFVANQTRLLGLIAVSDPVKAGSAAAIHELQAMGLTVCMLTGDRKETAQALQAELGISQILAEVLPADKEQKIAELQASGNIVAMVGDGINDAPALARANVGIAIGAGSDIALESADVILMKNDLQQVVLAIQLSQSVLKNIRQNLFWAFFYNSLGIPLAAGAFYTLSGWTLSPMVAAAAMSFSSVTVVMNALRLRHFKPTLKCPETPQRDIHPQKFNEKKSSIMEKKIISIEGMSCTHCSSRVEKALNALDGVEASVSLNDKKAYVTTNGQVSNDTLKNAVTTAGYDVVDIEEANF